MSKELRAFKRICNNLNSYEFTDECKKNKKLIETALKELEVKREVIRDILTGDDEKKLKAFEIIKERNIDVSLIKNTKNYDEYCDDFAMKVLLLKDERFFIKNKGITQEEYELLKEVLL